MRNEQAYQEEADYMAAIEQLAIWGVERDTLMVLAVPVQLYEGCQLVRYFAFLEIDPDDPCVEFTDEIAAIANAEKVQADPIGSGYTRSWIKLPQGAAANAPWKEAQRQVWG